MIRGPCPVRGAHRLGPSQSVMMLPTKPKRDRADTDNTRRLLAPALTERGAVGRCSGDGGSGVAARSKQRHPFAGSVRIRARELARRPTVLLLFIVQAGVVLVLDVNTYLEAAGTGRVGENLVMRGLRAGAVPGGLLFGVLAASVVGAEFSWSTERALLARDPRRSRFVALQLSIVLALAAVWILLQAVFAAGAGLLLRQITGPATAPLPLEDLTPVWWAAAALASATVIYALLGTACALGFRGGLPGAVAVLAYGLLGELVLAPLWGPASDWTVYAATSSLAGDGDLPLERCLTVLGAAALLALAAAFAAYHNREVRE